MEKSKNILGKIKVTPLAAESFGVRSMCTLVQTPDISVLLDAGISLCPYRFSLPPHPIEFQAIAKLRKKIADAAEKAQVVTISHYHFDHHTPSYEDWVVNWTKTGETARKIYQGKTLFVKNPKININASQRHRAWMFQKTCGKTVRRLVAADGKTFTFGETTLRFSEAVPHGSENSTLGWVIMTTVDLDGERFMFAPDIQGPMSNHTTELILTAQPTAIMLGGPPLYLANIRIEESQLEQGLKNLQQIVLKIPIVVLDHHLLRDEDWKRKISFIYQQTRKTGHELFTAAEYAGSENLFLESKRKQLFDEHPPSKEFNEWVKTLNNEKISKPPI